MIRVSYEGPFPYLSQIMLFVKGSTTDRPSLQRVKDLKGRLAKLGSTPSRASARYPVQPSTPQGPDHFRLFRLLRNILRYPLPVVRALGSQMTSSLARPNIDLELQSIICDIDCAICQVAERAP
jgi:hypothetical protein